MNSVSGIPTGQKILIVEDSRTVSHDLKRSIEEKLGFDADVVATYDDARDYLSQNARDIFLAILDLNLPGSPDGEVVDLFCSLVVPSIIFSSDFSEKTRSRMQAKGVIDYVVKDVHAVDNIIGYIDRLIRNKETKVLVVEDSESFRFSLCSMLHKQMFQVLDVASGEAAIKALAADEDIRLVVTDYEMPGINGVELTKAIRGRASKDEVAIIGLSSSSDPMLTARFIKGGANDFIAKPFGAEEFYSRINHNVEVLERIQALSEANKVKNQFLGMAVHDLRSPINGINGLSELLLEDLCGPLNDEQREMIEHIHSANKHMNSMVSDLLDISVIESGELKLLKGESSLKELLSDRVRIHGMTATKKTIKIVAYLSDVADFVFDFRRVGQVLDNLLTNAIKFSPTGETIEVSLGEESGDAKVCVRDHGQGVPPGEEMLLFQSFKKTSVLPTGGESSTGLGLPIVKKIVEAHGGQVWVESEYRDGASFCFTLPMT